MSHRYSHRFLLPLHGAVSLGMRRLIVILGAASTLIMTLGNWAGVMTAISSVPGPVLWSLLGPTLIGPLVAGIAAAAALWRSRARSDPEDLHLEGRPQWLDRVWQASLLLAVLGYGAAVAVTTMVPLIPTLEPHIASRTTPLSNHYIIIGLAAPTVLSARTSVVYAVILAPPIALMLFQSRGQGALMAIEEPMIVLTFVLAQIGALSAAVQQADAQDRIGARRRRDSIALAQERARTQAQRQRDSFVHDHILSVLVSIAGGLKDSERMRLAARNALESLQARTADQHPVAASHLFKSLTTNAAVLAPGMQAVTDITEDHLLPPEIARAIQDSTGEAIRNSLRHAAGPSQPQRAVRRTLALSASPQQVRVVISDDGKGFDPQAPNPGRHGITGSIHQRLQDVGARAHIASSPGLGTTVTITWRPQSGTDTARRSPLADPSARSHPDLQPSRPVTQRRVAAAMQTTAARAIAGYGIASHVVIALLEIHAGSYLSAPPVLASMLVQLVAAMLLLRTWPNAAIPNWAVGYILAIVATSNLSVLLAFRYDGWPGFASWATGSATTLCCGMMMRQRPIAAWTGQALLVATTAIWLLQTNRPLIMALTFMLPSTVALFLWHLVVNRCIAASTALEALERHAAQVLALRQAERTTNQVMDEAMTSVRTRAQPLLIQLATGCTSTPELRTRARLLEAELRDEIRAPFFTGTAVITAAKDARTRGVEVLLLDDSNNKADLSKQLRNQIIHNVTSTLENTTSDRVVVRIEPPGRTTVLSVTTDDTNYQLTADGETISFGT